MLKAPSVSDLGIFFLLEKVRKAQARQREAEAQLREVENSF